MKVQPIITLIMMLSLTTQGQVTSETHANLTASEINDLIRMSAQEKLAQDVYLTLYEQLRFRVFQQTPQNEHIHINAIKSLLNKYNITDPHQEAQRGVFARTELTTRYQELVAQGKHSLVDAFHVGAQIEDKHIVQLQAALAQTDNQDIQAVYQFLLRGSRNQLRTFAKLLHRSGTHYQPHALSLKAFQSIIQSPHETAATLTPQQLAQKQIPGRGSGWHHNQAHPGCSQQ